MVEEPGPDVMRLRVAITNLELPKRSLKSIMTGKGPGLGEISMEFESLDSVTGQRIAAGVDQRTGTRIREPAPVQHSRGCLQVLGAAAALEDG